MRQPKQTDLFQDVKYEPLNKSKTQRCSTCKKYKPFNMFAFREPTVAKSLRSECRKCKNISDRLVSQLKLENPKPVDKNYKCPICNKNSHTISNDKVIVDKDYNVYEGLLIRCFVLDHDHITGKVRGYICSGCNQAMGKMGDNIEGLDRAIKYLKGELNGSTGI